MNSDQAIDQARAKIIWGDPVPNVRAWLTTNGHPEAEADAIIIRLVAERNAEIRRLGWRNILIGLGFMMLAGLPILTTQPNPPTKAFFFGVVAGGIGCVTIIGGILKLVRPKSVTGSLSVREK